MKKILSPKQSSRTIGSSVFCKKPSDIKNKPEKILIFAAFLLFTYILYYFRIGCVWNFFFGFPCPGCGITRAYIAFFSGDFCTAFKYNFMFFSVPVIFLYILYDGRIFKRKIVDIVILSLVGLGFFINRILKM